MQFNIVPFLMGVILTNTPIMTTTFPTIERNQLQAVPMTLFIFLPSIPTSNWA